MKRAFLNEASKHMRGLACSVPYGLSVKNKKLHKNYKQMKKVACIIFILTLAIPQLLIAEGLKSFKLKNGLTVYVWEDSTQTDVFGMVAVKTGSANDPEAHTGLAHYLEHVMFKGTDRIGALEWSEEQPVYQQIIAKYDERANEADPVKKVAIDKEINDLSVEQSKLSISNEFSTLVESIGGTGLNAGTSFDRTVFLNSFPVFQLERWVELYSSRLINPVFRTFQAELENVYEEYNMYSDSKSTQLQNFILSTIFAGHPYGRPIIGSGEHLKNPQLSKLIDFYNQYYVPENMALILVGNVKTEDVVKVVTRKFGRIPAKTLPIVVDKPATPIKGRMVASATLGDNPETMLIFNAVPERHEDNLKIQVCLELLSNSNRTGLLDKLALDGDLMYASASLFSLSDDGKIIISAIPSYDIGQARYESHKYVEKLLMEQIGKLKSGKIEDWLLQSIKDKICRTNALQFESNKATGSILADAFICGVDIDRIINHDSIVQSITMADINIIANEYLNDNILAIHIDQGKAPKKDKMPVTERTKSVESSLGKETTYRTWFQSIPTGTVNETYSDMQDVKIAKVNDLSRLFYMQNKVNGVFTLTLKYGAGTRLFPNLNMSVYLMNDAGVMASLGSQEFKREMSVLNASCTYRCDEDYTYVLVSGDEAKLQEICDLITKQILMPKLDDKLMNNIKGQILQGRFKELEDPDELKSAMMEYLLYGSKSDYIDRLTNDQIMKASFPELIGDFQRATSYAADIHYVGRRTFEDVTSILSAHLPLKQGEQASESPKTKPRVQYKETMIYFVPSRDLRQSELFFFVEGPSYNPEVAPQFSIFNQYFDGGFGGLVLNEIREKNSMAYNASGKFEYPSRNGDKSYFFGNVGTQNEKAFDAIGLYLKLVNEMPQIPERMGTIKDYIHKSLLTNKPSFRYASQVYESYKLLGFKEDPAKTIVPAVDKMSIEDVIRFNAENLKGKPIVIGIVGDPRAIDLKALEKYGKVNRLSVAELFK